MACGSRSHSTSQLRDSRSFLFYFLLFWNVKIYVQQSNTAYQSTNLSMGCIKIRWHDWYSWEFFKLGGGKGILSGSRSKKKKVLSRTTPRVTEYRDSWLKLTRIWVTLNYKNHRSRRIGARFGASPGNLAPSPKVNRRSKKSQLLTGRRMAAW